LRILVRSFDFHQEGDPEPHPELFPKAFCDELELLINAGQRYADWYEGMQRLTGKTHGALEGFERGKQSAIDSLHHLKAVHHEVCEA